MANAFTSTGRNIGDVATGFGKGGFEIGKMYLMIMGLLGGNPSSYMKAASMIGGTQGGSDNEPTVQDKFGAGGEFEGYSVAVPNQLMQQKNTMTNPYLRKLLMQPRGGYRAY